jgi:acetolactate synthase-1/2/3 large subunit
MAKMTAAQFIADTFASYGVTQLFFVPVMLSRTLAEIERRTSIQRIMTHGEKSAAYMADGYARASGRVGVCMSQCIGSANLAAGLRDAHLACTPLIAITGGPYSHTRDRHTYQQVEDLPSFKPVTKYSADVDDISRLPDVLRQAFRAATTGTPGPAHIQMIGHMGEFDVEEAEFEVIKEERFGQLPPFRPEPDAQSVAEVARLLEAAERPIIVAGGGVRTSGAGAELVALAEKLAIPVATSMNAKDIIPGNHPLSVGIPGIYCRKSASRAVLEADLVFFVGSHTGSQVTFEWRIPPVGTPVIQLDINGAELGRHYPNRASILGDAKVSLARLLEETDGTTAASRKDWVAQAQGLVQEWRQEFAPVLQSDQVPIRPERVCKELTDNLPGDAILVSDTGHAGMWMAGFIDLNKPGQNFIRAAGSLGWGMPAALGAKLACPERPVVCFTGDGGIWYHLAELETAVRWNIPAVIVINNNRSLNQEIAVYSKAYGGELEGRHGELWQFQDIGFAKLAQCMGAEGIRVDKPGAFAGALDQALNCGKPCVIDVVAEVEAVAPLGYLPPNS